ncbi:hypothetical protein Vafri_2032 [Volvox africanus]|nr:hypothetical protein Vafri_2032 [Volvox africanus]
MGGDTKPHQAQKAQDAQKHQAGEKEKQGDGLNQGAGKRKPQDKDNKEKNKRRRPDKPAAVKGIQFRLLCYEGQAGAVIGKGGETVRNIRKTSNAEVSVLPPIQGHRLRVIAIDSPPGNRAAMSYPAKEALLTCSTLTVEGDQPLTAPDPSKMVEVRLLVQSDLATGLLGLKHSLGSLTAGDISARCGANVIMPPDSDRPKLAESGEEYLLLRGPWPAVYAALGMVADEVRRQFFELREPPAEPPLGPPPAAFGFPGGPAMGPPLGPFDPLEAMQLGIGLGMEMAVAAGVAGPHMAGPVHGNAPLPGGGSGGGLSVPHGGDLSVSGLIPEFRNSAEMSTPVTVTFKLVVPENKAGRFIGKGGENLRDIRLALGLSTLKVHPAVKDTAVRVLEVTSTEPAGSKRCAAAEALLYYVERLGVNAPQNTNANTRGRFTVKMLLQQLQCGPVVGPRAAVIRQVSALTNTSCVVHKKGDMPPYGAPDEQELEAEGDPPNVMEAVRMVAAIIRGCELRRQGISVRETMGTPEFDLVRGGGGGGPHGPFAPMGPMMPAAPSDGGAMGHVGPAGASQQGPSMPTPSQQRQMQQMPQQQYPPQQQLHEERYMPTPTQPQGHLQASDPLPQQQQQLPPHLQKPPLQQPPQLGAGTSAGQSTVGSQGGPAVAALPPLGPNDVRLTIFVAAALVNAPEGVNGTNVQQVQAVTNTVVTLRQPVPIGDYELDITGTIAQVMQAHTLLSNIMTIGAILQQKPQLAPQQAPPTAVGAVGGAAGGPGQPSAVTATAPVTTSSGAQHQVVVQPNQGVVIATQPPPQQQQQTAAIQSPVHPQQGASQQQQQQQQQSQQPAPQPAAQAQAAPTSMQGVPSQPPAAFSGAGQRIPQQQQQQQQQRQQAPLQQQQTQVQQPVQQQQQQQRPLQQPSQGVPQQQQQRPQQYPYNSELAVSAQQEAPVQRQTQTQQQPYPAQPTAQSQPPVQQQPAPQPAAVASAPYQQQTQTQQPQSVPQASTYMQTPATPAATLQPQQYGPAPQTQSQQPVYSQQYGQPYPQQGQTQQNAYYGQQASQAQQTQAQGANPYATYGSAGYSSTNGTAQAPAAAPVQPGSQSATTTYDGQYAHAAATVQAQTPPTGAPATGPAPGAASTTTAYGPQSQQQPYPGYGAAGYQTAPTTGHPYYQQSSQAPPQQQPQQPSAPSAHDQYYMHMQQQYAAYQAAAAAAATASTPYTPGVYGYSYGTSSAPGPQ